MPSAVRLAPLVVFAALLDCTTFAPLPAGTCGNGVIDAKEDCDSFAVGATACRPPSSQTGACRFDCSNTACPTGYGCGVDKICRQPSGKYTRTGNPIAAGVWRMQTGDFDGDGRQDLLSREPLDPGAQSKLRIHYFDGNAALAKTLIIPPAMASPNVIDTNADGRSDIVFSTLGTLGGLGGIGSMLGQQDRTLTPVAYPTFTFPSLARLIPVNGITGGTTFFFYTKAANGAAIGYADGSTTVSLVTLPGGPDPTGASIGVGNLYNDECGEAVLALPKASEVLVYPLCKKDGGQILPNDHGGADLVRVKLPNALNVDHGVLVADADGDGKLDLLIGALDGMPARQKTYVAYGTGAAGFKSSRTGGVDNQAAIFRLNLLAMEDFEPGLPLAVGDMNSDGHPDFVTPSEVLTSFRGTGIPGDDASDAAAIPLVYRLAGQKARGTWTDAVIADFNGNGYPDAIAGSSATLDLDFFNGNGTEAFSTFSLTTNGPATSFSVADVDGDYLPDLVFSQTATSGDQLTIAYGKAGGAPDTPTVVGTFQRIMQTVTYDPGAPLSNIVVVDRPIDTRETSTSISLLAGTGDRVPLALFSLSHPKVVTGIPFGVVAAPFSKAGNVDVAAVGDDLDPISRGPSASYRLWLAKSVGGGSPQLNAPIDGPKLADQAQPIISTDASFGISLLLAQGDLDHDGTPEVVAVTPLSQLGDGSDSQILIAKPRGDAMAFDVSTVPLGVPAATDGQLAVADVDGDGAPDIVLLAGKDGAFALSVYWNDGSGHFDAKRLTTIGGKNDPPTGFALVNVAAKEQRAIAYVTRHKVFVIHMNGRDAVSSDPIESTKEATGVVAADVDGDGVEDLCIADSNNIVILRAQAVLQ